MKYCVPRPCGVQRVREWLLNDILAVGKIDRLCVTTDGLLISLAGDINFHLAGTTQVEFPLDRSDPNHVVLTTTDSNLWGGASGHTYTFTGRPDGLTDIDVVVVRDGKNLKGRLLGIVLGTIGKSV
jgi:hypothetical protein